ncbi:MAG: RtcB family protein [Anaerolineae bacterium]|nr:RtcB family protein [Anaerolineae bacterium]
MSSLVKLDEYVYEIPASYRADMRVPARLYADEMILQAALEDRSLEQLANVAWLPGIVSYALAMPDIHEGYGFPIGGVAATRVDQGVVSPGGVGYDINCGVRLLASNLDAEEVRPYLARLMDAAAQSIPAGVGRGGDVRLQRARLDDALEGGAQWAIGAGFGRREDAEHCEEGGTIARARADAVSARAKDRGRDQLGTLGSGNHFVELDEVAEVYDAQAADAFGLRPGQLVAQIHSGSRGLGHQVCTDYVRSFQSAAKRYGYSLPDRELVCAPIASKDGQDYLAAMSAAANFAWANRQVMTDALRRAFEEALLGKLPRAELVVIYDVAHNVAKIETHRVNGRPLEVCVHRKGATRAFPPGHDAVPVAYRSVGQPVLVPGDMGTASYVLRGTQAAMERSFGSSCHGAGRVLSRRAARGQVDARQLVATLEGRGMEVRAGSMKGLAEEAPEAYKDIHRVVEVVHGAGLATKVARLHPIGVIKG